MFYQRSYEIERRLEAVLRMIREGRFSTPKIAKEIGVSIPTISRDVTALRQRGHEIRAEWSEHGWRYVLAKPQNASHRRLGQPDPQNHITKETRLTI